MYTGTALHNFLDAKIISSGFLYPDKAWRKSMEELSQEGIAQDIFSLARETPLELLAAEHTRLFGSNPACSYDIAEYISEQPFLKAQLRQGFVGQAQKMAEMAGFYRAFGLE